MSVMALRRILILRRPRSGCLEGGIPPIRQSVEIRTISSCLSRRIGIAAAAAVVGLALSATLAPYLWPGSAVAGDTTAFAATVIFAASYLALAIGKIPGLNIDRAGVALVGASLMVAAGVLPLDSAYRAIDLDTLTLLLGIMIVVANLRLSGFFALAAAWIGARTQRPTVLLAAVVAISGVFSAFLVNDAICLILAPLVLELTQRLERNPVPYLLAVAMASNIGSAATLSGNPQNILIATLSHLSYAHFALTLMPVALIGLLLTVSVIAIRYRDEFGRGPWLPPRAPVVRIHRMLAARALAAAGIMVALFFAGAPPAKAAIVIGGLLLLTRRLRSERIYREIDWPLLLMFVGLFIIVAGAERKLMTAPVVAAVGHMHLDAVPVLSLVTALLSNLVSNVPAVLVLKPFVASLPGRDSAWMTVAMASTLAGNLTLLGSIANLIVVHRAAAGGVHIGFAEYLQIGLPLSFLTLTIGTLWLWF
jgi:Na+/H+ antiporter NhaD/arsenite permease-like protein